MKPLSIYLIIIIIVLAVGVFADTSAIKMYKGTISNKSINLTSLPPAINIKKVDNTTIAIYQINGSSRPLFMITASGNLFRKTQSTVYEIRTLLSFGVGEETSSSEFLKMPGMVQGGAKKGYVMMRSGSITGISTNLEILKSASGEGAEIIIYKNGKNTDFENFIPASSTGVKIDYDTQSKGILTFNPGDVISVYLKLGDGLSASNIATSIEITSR